MLSWKLLKGQTNGGCIVTYRRWNKVRRPWIAGIHSFDTMNAPTHENNGPWHKHIRIVNIKWGYFKQTL